MDIREANNWQRPAIDGEDRVRAVVADLLADIRRRGDAAIEAYSLKFDGFAPRAIDLKPWRDYDLDDETRTAIDAAAVRIEAFAEMQRGMYRDLSFEDGHGRYGQRVIPLERMAAYIPGGRFPLVSTALMTLIPARVAGVTTRVAVSPSDHPGILAAASRAGATRFLQMGGAQAIGALAFGCALEEKVDMVVGPGNAYVNAAKALVQDRIAIDSLAGPSEILVLCYETVDPEWIALDVLAQAEHDPMALSVLGSTSRTMLEAVAAIVTREAEAHPEKDTGVIELLHCRDSDEMIDLANQMAAEHLHVACALDTDRIHHYGSLFIGGHSAVALGDYCSGPNHTLPTMANARQKGGLMVGDFLKIATWQEINPETYPTLARTAIALARVEDLRFHQRSLEVRMP